MKSIGLRSMRRLALTSSTGPDQHFAWHEVGVFVIRDRWLAQAVAGETLMTIDNLYEK